MRLSLSYIAHLLDQKYLGDECIVNYAIDSRDKAPDMLFFAIKGAKSDGHDYLQQACENGAISAIISTTYQGPIPPNVIIFRVDDVQEALQCIATKAIQEYRGSVVAITGSIGKTTTKDFLATFLSTHFSVYKTPQSYNSQLTLPLSILRASGDEDFMVLEMGISLAGEMDRLIAIAPPDYAIVTQIAASHIAGFNSLEHLAKEKALLLSNPKTHLAMVCADGRLANVVQKQASCPIRTYGMHTKYTDYYLEESNDDHVVIHVATGTSFSVIPPYLGRHLHVNLLAAVGMAIELGVPVEKIIASTSSLQLSKGRMELLTINGTTFINDTYNANEESMKGALDTLASLSHHGRKIAVLGCVVEQGNFASDCHRAIGHHAAKCSDMLLCTGNYTEELLAGWKEKTTGHCFPNVHELGHYLKQIIKEGDCVLVKGSRSYHMEDLFNEFMQ